MGLALGIGISPSLGAGVAGEVNLLLNPTDLSAWYYEGLTVVNAGQPNQAVKETASDEWHIFRQSVAKPAIAKKYRVAVVLKPNLGRDLFSIFVTTSDFGNGYRLNFNATTLAVLSGGGYGTFDIVPGSAYAAALVGGFVEVGFDLTTGSETSVQITGYLEIVENGENYLGDSAKGMSIREVRLYDRGFPDPIVLSANDATYRDGDFYTANNVYAGVTLVNGVDFTQSVTVQPAFFPARTSAQWSWPSGTGESSYTVVTFGCDSRATGFPGMPPTMVVNNITTLTATFDMTVIAESAEYNLLCEAFLYDDADCTWPPEVEIGIFFHASHNASVLEGPISFGSISGSLYSQTVTLGSDSWVFYTVVPDTEVSAATIEVKALLLAMKALGHIAGTEYIGSWRTGVEPRGGAGSMTLNSLSVVWN